VTAILVGALTACGGSEQAKLPPRVKVGKPYAVDGREYRPKVENDYDETGEASWYGPGFHGNYTANGERFDQNDLTAAHPTLPMPSLVRVTNLDNGKSAIVRVNDRGPFTKDRIIDLSKGSAEELGVIRTGTAHVRVQFLRDQSEQLWAGMGAEAPKEVQMASTALPEEDVQNDAGFVESGYTSSSIQSVSAPMGTVTGRDLPPPSLPQKSAAYSAPVYQQAPQMQQVSYVTASEEVSSLPDEEETTTEENVQMAQAAFEPVYPVPAGDVEVKQAQRVVSSKPGSRTQTPARVTQPEQPIQSSEPASGARYEAPSSTSPYIQVGAFGVRENAEVMVRKLAGIGKANISAADSNGRTWYRVRLPVTDSNAETALERVQALGVKDARIVHP